MNMLAKPTICFIPSGRLSVAVDLFTTGSDGFRTFQNAGS